MLSCLLISFVIADGCPVYSFLLSYKTSDVLQTGENVSCDTNLKELVLRCFLLGIKLPHFVVFTSYQMGEDNCPSIHSLAKLVTWFLSSEFFLLL